MEVRLIHPWFPGLFTDTSEHIIFTSSVFHFVVVGSVRVIKLIYASFLAHVKIVYRVVSYCMRVDHHCRWLGSRVVSVLESGAEGPGFKSQSGKSSANCSHPLCLCSPSSEIGSSPLKGWEGHCRPGGK